MQGASCVARRVRRRHDATNMGRFLSLFGGEHVTIFPSPQFRNPRFCSVASPGPRSSEKGFELLARI